MEKKKYNYEEYTHLIGQKINAYKFDSDPNGPLGWSPNKQKLVGKEGKIIEVHSSYPYIKIEFVDNDDEINTISSEWWLAYGHEDYIVKEKTEDELYGDIYKLLTKI